MNKYFRIFPLLLSLGTLSSCLAAAGMAGIEGATTIAQERSAGARIDDNAIALKINKKFLEKDENLFAAVSTEITEGRVLLTGRVKDPTTKKDAEELVWQVSGVREVINEITITNQQSFRNYMSDAWITQQIKARMLFTEGIKSANFGVQTVNNVVYLMGIAQNEKEMKVAIEIARRTKNVQKVVSHVILKDDPRRQNVASQDTTYSSNSSDGSYISTDRP